MTCFYLLYCVKNSTIRQFQVRITNSYNTYTIKRRKISQDYVKDGDNNGNVINIS